MITIQRQQLLDVLTVCERLQYRTFHPTLQQYAYFASLSDSSAEVYCTDGEMSVRSLLDVSAEETTSCLLPIPVLSRIARLERDEYIHLQPGTDRIEVRANAHYSLSTTSPETYPLKEEKEVKPAYALESHALFTVLSQTRFAIDKHAPHATGGALIELDGDQLTVCTTDSRRLALSRATCTEYRDKPTSYLIHARAVELLITILRRANPGDIVTLGQTRNQHLAIHVPLHDVIVPLLEHRFPAYREVIGKLQHVAQFSVGCALLLNHISRCLLATTKDSPGVTFHYDHGTLTLSVDTERGRVVATMPAEGDAAQLSTILDGNYLREYLLRADAGRPVTVKYHDNSHAVLFSQDESYQYYQMPMLPRAFDA